MDEEILDEATEETIDAPVDGEDEVVDASVDEEEVEEGFE